MEIGKGIIELPSDAIENMMWLTRLDSGSLAGLLQAIHVCRVNADLVTSMDGNLCGHTDPSSSGLISLPSAAHKVY